jgi:hypothetical protein
MKTLETHFGAEHMALLEIFFKANKLENVKLSEYHRPYNGENHKYIEISWDDNSETGVQISFMSVVHMGFLNMLDDFLLKCGVDVQNIGAESFRVQKRREVEEQKQKEFDVYFNQRKQSVQSGQNP